jgi:hypothetical protein
MCWICSHNYCLKTDYYHSFICASFCDMLYWVGIFARARMYCLKTDYYHSFICASFCDMLYWVELFARVCMYCLKTDYYHSFICASFCDMLYWVELFARVCMYCLKTDCYHSFMCSSVDLWPCNAVTSWLYNMYIWPGITRLCMYVQLYVCTTLWVQTYGCTDNSTDCLHTLFNACGTCLR